MKSELQHVRLHERVTVTSLPPRRPKPLSVLHLQPHHLLIVAVRVLTQACRAQLELPAQLPALVVAVGQQ
jgi:hypothetical protein